MVRLPQLHQMCIRDSSNTELVAQGLANIASPLFGGIPATGAIARTMTNINNGGKTPIEMCIRDSIAAYHVLHRLREPRHPPYALSYFLYDCIPVTRFRITNKRCV